MVWYGQCSPTISRTPLAMMMNMAHLMKMGVGMVLDMRRVPLELTMEMIFLLMMMVIALISVFLFSESKIMAIILTFICGALAFSISSPINIVMMQNAKNSEMLGAAFIQSAFNVSNSLGAFVGGIPLLLGYSYIYPSLIGAILAFIGVVLCIIFFKKYNTY